MDRQQRGLRSVPSGKRTPLRMTDGADVTEGTGSMLKSAISLREAGRALLVGERIAGSAGNPISLPLPGGGQFQMATFRAYLPDGGEYVGIGLTPDVEMAATKEDIRNGVDPVMQPGLQVLADWNSYSN